MSRVKMNFSLQNQLEAADKLQKTCSEIYITVTSSLTTGMSENDISEMVGKEFLKRGIANFWYDVPIFVLIGEERFFALKEQDYEVKRPKSSVQLIPGDVIYIDMHPQDSQMIWGDYNSMCVFKPQGEDEEKVTFLKLIYSIHQAGIKTITPSMTASKLFQWYENQYAKHGITLVDKRDTVGHQMTWGAKKDDQGNYRISFLDKNNNEPLSGGIYAIEPGGYRKQNGQLFVGRFEDCIYIPKQGKAVILGRKDPPPLLV